MQGYIKLHRQIKKWEWYTDIPVKVLFLHLLLKANHTQDNWRGQEIKQGELITSLQHLADETGLSVKQVRTALDKLKNTGEVASKGHSRFSVISIKNWDKFQIEGKQTASKGQAEGKQRATNNNVKNDKNDKNDKNINSLSCSDPFGSKNKKIFSEEYQKVFNKKVYLGRNELIRLSEIAKDNDLEEVLPIALKRLKVIDFKDIDYKPDANWLLRGNNFERVMNGEFGSKEEEKQQAIQQEQDKQKAGLERLRALNPELAEQLERTMNEV